jgi:hypothetical protein
MHLLFFSHVPWYHFQSLVDSLVGWLTKVCLINYYIFLYKRIDSLCLSVFVL